MSFTLVVVEVVQHLHLYMAKVGQVAMEVLVVGVTVVDVTMLRLVALLTLVVEVVVAVLLYRVVLREVQA
ncbi:MAG TPA: hypothetical protein VN580_01415 [Clostridia bacterium]|nr:hypothetical protein [Clostridia bacterium]